MYLQNCTINGTYNLDASYIYSCTGNITGLTNIKILKNSSFASAVISGLGAGCIISNNPLLKNIIILVPNNVNVTGNTVSETISITSDYNKITNNIITGLLTLNSGSENNIIQGNTLTGGLTDSSASATNIIKDNI